MKYAGIVGHPVAHSLSPVFQGAAFRESGLDVRYERWDTEPESLAARILNLRHPDCLGANVTIPYKEAVFPLVDELGGQSARVGAVNTIVNRGGRLYGFNTDGPGFVQALRRERGFDVAGRSMLLLGAGGAARGIGFALADANAGRIAISNRTQSRAAQLARDIAAAGAECVSEPNAASREYDCIVNCTSIGMHGGPAPGESPLDVERLPGAPLIVDIVYAPEETPLLAQARRRGLRTLGGLPMLVFQGALAFELWTGAPAPTETMFDALRRELANREAAIAT